MKNLLSYWIISETNLEQTATRSASGVTRVGDTRGDIFFAHRLYHYRFLLLSLWCHPTPFLPVRPRFSTILCKFADKFFPLGVTPLEGVTRGGPP